MGKLLYGNLQVEIVGDHGARIDRLSLRPAPLSLVPRPPAPQSAHTVMPLGRDKQIDDVYDAVRTERPLEFAAPCGYGKSTLLKYVAACSVRERVVRSSVYLQVGFDGLEDVLQRLVAELYTFDPPVKPTPDQCAQLLSQARMMVVLDDVTLDPGRAAYLLRVLSGCSLLLGSRRPVLGRHGTSQILGGLPGNAAIGLIARELGRQLKADELAAVKRLIDAVDGQPLHLRQSAALARADGLSFESLASTAERDPEELDRLSVNALAGQERRALAVLALAAGALLPADLVATMGDIALIGQSLGQLCRRGLAEQQDDRFGLPVCKAEGYRQMLLKDLHLAAALRELVGWLAARDPSSADSLSAVGAVLAIIEWAAERGEWEAVARLVRVAEPILMLAGRWEALHQVLGRGLEAATTTGDRAAEAFFAHQQGTLAFCRDKLDDTERLLERALQLREQLADYDGAAITRHNLQLLRPAPPPPPTNRPARSPRTTALAAAGVLIGLVLTVGAVRAASLGTAHQSDHRASIPRSSLPGSGGTHRGRTHGGPPGGHRRHGGGNQGGPNAKDQTITFTSQAPGNASPGGTYTPAADGGGSGNPVTSQSTPPAPACAPSMRATP